MSLTLKYAPIVISGPSGVGKSSLLKFLFRDYPNQFTFMTSHTTRKAREGEIDGESYNFIDKDTFANMIKANEFIEYTHIYDNFYGSSYKELINNDKHDKITVFDIDVEGAKNIQANKALKTNFLFILPPSKEVLEERLKGRGSETEESLKKRLNHCETECEKAKKSGVYREEDFMVMHNFDSYQEFLVKIKAFYPNLGPVQKKNEDK